MVVVCEYIMGIKGFEVTDENAEKLAAIVEGAWGRCKCLVGEDGVILNGDIRISEDDWNERGKVVNAVLKSCKGATVKIRWIRYMSFYEEYT